MKEKKILKIASPGKRLGAFLIDELILWAAVLICIALMAVPASVVMNGFHRYHSFDAMMGFGFLSILLIGSLIYLVVELYFFSKAQTIGKAILGIKVINKDSGKDISFWWMFFREVFVKKASAVVFCLGYIWILIDKNNQAWHDKILDTYVIDSKKTETVTIDVEEEDTAKENVDKEVKAEDKEPENNETEKLDDSEELDKPDEQKEVSEEITSDIESPEEK